MVTKEVKLSLVVISVSVTLVSVMIAFGEIDFFEGMSCEELEKFVSEIPRGEYPFGTPFTPSQIDFLDQQYNDKCGSQPRENLTHKLLTEKESYEYSNLFHEGISYYESNREINNINT